MTGTQSYYCKNCILIQMTGRAVNLSDTEHFNAACICIIRLWFLTLFFFSPRCLNRQQGMTIIKQTAYLGTRCCTFPQTGSCSGFHRSHQTWTAHICCLLSWSTSVGSQPGMVQLPSAQNTHLLQLATEIPHLFIAQKWYFKHQFSKLIGLKMFSLL
jgi:hypothetical protein